MTLDAMSVAIAALFTALTGGVGAVWHALLTGRLVIGREFERVVAENKALAETYRVATDKLDAAHLKEREALSASVIAAERRTAEIGARLDRLIERQGEGSR